MINSPLLTDHYQLTMACAYWRRQMAEQESVFHLFFRRHPFRQNYTIACGLARIVEFIQQWQFTSVEIDYLRTLRSPQGSILFEEEFLHYLSQLRFIGDIDAMIEGSIVFPNEPILRIKAPIIQCQLLETALTNYLQFSSLVATKSAQICQTASPDAVIEFGLRRAQGPDGGLMASRAAYIGGCAGTSNVLAGQYYQIPLMGTQAHSWVMAFPDEVSAFEAFAQAMPDNVIFLVDTYHTIEGVQHAIAVGKALKKNQHALLGIRLDSGDLLTLSRTARQLLDEAGFQTTKILASGDLDEQTIHQLKAQKAPIDIWGVGTRLVTCYEKPALDMVYKLSAIKNTHQTWDYKIKISDSSEKTTIPGIQQIRRYFHHKQWVGDVLFDENLGVDDQNFTSPYDQIQDLLIPIFRQGKQIYDLPETAIIRDYCLNQVKSYLKSNTKDYKIQLEPHLAMLQKTLIEKKR